MQNKMMQQILKSLLKSGLLKSKKGGLIGALIAALIGGYVISDSQAQRPQKSGNHVAGKFDYFSMVLSWSPTYCAENRHDKVQCGPRRAYAFVVHGLWPQYKKGWPQNCRVPKGDYYVQKNTINSMLDIMPSRRLVIHEWRKHGTCAGVSQKKYFSATRALYKKIKVPARFSKPNQIVTTSPQQLKTAFVQTNKWLKPDMMSIHCGNRKDRGRLRELRFCFSKSGKPRTCGQNERRGCRAKTLVLPAVR